MFHLAGGRVGGWVGGLSISIFRRLSLFLRSLLPCMYPRGCLSISIFRRLSLFPVFSTGFVWGCTVLSISIFRRLSLFRITVCLSMLILLFSLTFNLHFQETFFVSTAAQIESDKLSEDFQSPFSGDFLCF